MIYRRFTEKSAEEWRQIYKALQLLEFLIKHGSERVIDDARSHISLLKMLRQFHFIDQNGKDQGINVRNRAKELAELLGDVDRIRSERKKARAAKNKYTGVEGGGGSMGGFSSGSSSRYGGFGSESAGQATFGGTGYSSGVYGDGGGFGGESNEYQASGSRADRFEEYDEFDEDERPPPARVPKRPDQRVGVKKTTSSTAKPKAPEVDLFSFDDPTPSSSAAPSGGSGMAALAPTPIAANDDDDEFDDFQSAAPAASSNAFGQPAMAPVTAAASSTAQFASPQPRSAPQQADISQMVSMSSVSPVPSAKGTPSVNYSAFSIPSAPAPQATAQPKAGFQSGPNYFGTIQAQPSGGAHGASVSGFSNTQSSNVPTTMANMKPVSSTPAKPAAGGGDAFGALWGKASAGIKKSSTPTAGPTMGQLAKEKSSAGIWGAPAGGSGSAAPKTGGSAMDDLLG